MNSKIKIYNKIHRKNNNFTNKIAMLLNRYSIIIKIYLINKNKILLTHQQIFNLTTHTTLKMVLS